VTAVNAILLASAIVPPIVVVLIFWFGLRSAKRHDERHGSR
jgi:hypothetical protein